MQVKDVTDGKKMRGAAMHCTTPLRVKRLRKGDLATPFCQRKYWYQGIGEYVCGSYFVGCHFLDVGVSLPRIISADEIHCLDAAH